MAIVIRVDFRTKNITKHKEGYLIKGAIHGNQRVETTQMSMCYIHRVEYYSVTKRDEVLIYATTWINTENIVK